ncbi:MAG: RNA-binding cell elongation regulator Jag/EloR, partial [Cyanobacteriota bacterium]
MQSIDQEGKTVEEALEKALVSLERTADEVNYEVLDEGSKGVLGVGARPILLRVRVKDIPEVSNAKNVLSKFLTELEVNFSSLEVTLGVDNIIKTSFDVPEEDIGIFIGKRGQTLDSLQYIVNQIMHESKFKFNIDISKYREKQHEKLRETIRKIAGSVEHTGRRVTLKPMSAFDRRIVHETVKEFTELVTKSIGLEPRRRVVISLVNDIVSEDDREYSPRYVDENVSNEGYKGGYNSRPNYNNNRSDSRPNYNNNRPDSRPSYDNNRPDSRPSYNNN